MTIRPILTLVTCLVLLTTNTFGQSSFLTREYVDINNTQALQLVHGDMWWDPPYAGETGCAFPNGSNTIIVFAGALWMSGYDPTNSLHIAAQTYRQKGNDYWPGPIDSTGTISYSTSKAWAKIWKVNRTSIDSFLSTSTHTATNTPTSILQWPAKGNPYAIGDSGTGLTINEDMAPFVDVNNDGIYNALQGDYPKIKGDQSLWWVFNDNGPVHTETNGTPLKVEIHAMAYAYKRGTMIDNAIYYEYTIINRSSANYNNFRVGQWICSSLGYAFDDYIGFDSTHRMHFTYNGVSADGTGQINSYGAKIPIMGLSMVSQPGDGNSNFIPAGSYIQIINNSSPQGNPTTPGQYNNYLRAMWKDSTHLKNDYTTPGSYTYGYGASYPDCNYLFPGDPSSGTEWSECNSGNVPDARTSVLATSSFTLNAGSSQTVTMALFATPPALNASCPNVSITAFQDLADTVWSVYQNPLPLLGVANMQPKNELHIYPNPAHDKIFIDKGITTGGRIIVYNILGQVMNVPVSNAQNIVQLNVEALTPGLYNILYSKNGITGSVKFVKE